MLVRAFKERHQRHMNKEAVFGADLKRDLAHRLNKRLRLYIAYRSADFGYNNVRTGLSAYSVNKILYLVCYMRYDLNGGAEIFSPALLIEHLPVDLAGGKVGILVQILVYKTLVMSEVKVGFGAVLGDVNLSVLIRAHGARVNIYIRVELLRRHLKPAAFKKPAERRRGYSLAETRNNASGNKYIFSHYSLLRFNNAAARAVFSLFSAVSVV